MDHDQLTRERLCGRAFTGFSEGAIRFLPTFKYDRLSAEYDSSSKYRTPSWTDRILYQHSRPYTLTPTSTKRVKGKKTSMSNTTGKLNGNKKASEVVTVAPQISIEQYTSLDEYMDSDHRPVYGRFVLY